MRKEIQMSLETNKVKGYFPKFYSCYYNKSQTKFYIVNELLSQNLNYENKGGRVKGKGLEFKNYFKSQERFKKYLEMFHSLMNLHAAGIVHGDLKPDNLMTNQKFSDPDQENLHIYFVDFGISEYKNSLFKLGP